MQRQECPICQEECLSLKFLTCKHSVCITCIDSMSIMSDIGQKYVKCPFDRLATLLPSNDAASLWSKLTVDLPCENCDTEKPIGDCWWCDTCQMSICSECAMKKHRMHKCDHWQEYAMIKDCFQHYVQHYPRAPKSCLEETEKIDKLCSDLKQFLLKAVKDEESAWNGAASLQRVFGGDMNQMISRQDANVPDDKVDKKLNLASKVVSKFNFNNATLPVEFNESLCHPVQLPMLEQILSLCFDTGHGISSETGTSIGTSQNVQHKMESGAKPKQQTTVSQSQVATGSTGHSGSLLTKKPTIAQKVQDVPPLNVQNWPFHIAAPLNSCPVPGTPNVTPLPSKTGPSVTPKVAKPGATSSNRPVPTEPVPTKATPTVPVEREMQLPSIDALSMCCINEQFSILAVLDSRFIYVVSGISGSILARKGWPNQTPKHVAVYTPQVIYRAIDHSLIVSKCESNESAGVLMQLDAHTLTIFKQNALPGERAEDDCCPRLICVLNDNSILIAHSDGRRSTMFCKHASTNFVQIWSRSNMHPMFTFMQKTNHTQQNLILISAISVIYMFTLTNQWKVIKYSIVSISAGPLFNVGLTTWTIERCSGSSRLCVVNGSTDQTRTMDVPKSKHGTRIDIDAVAYSYPYLFIFSRNIEMLRAIYLR